MHQLHLGHRHHTPTESNTMTILEPGIYPDVDPAKYHDGLFPGSVSYSTLKLLLEEAGPAKYIAAITGPRTEKRVFDLGTALHAELLGKGKERLEIIDAADYRTKAAREARDAAYEAGKTPLLGKEAHHMEIVRDLLPGHILEWFTGGTAEVAFLWDHPTGTPIRGQIDYLRDDAIIDLKTIRATDTRTVERQVWDLRYYMQAATYQGGYHLLTGAYLPYYIVTVDLANPHLSRAFEVPDDYLQRGRDDLDRAISIYTECTASGDWPAYGSEPAPLQPPVWARNETADNQAATEIAALETLLEGETND